jgi:hypothetical protein
MGTVLADFKLRCPSSQIKVQKTRRLGVDKCIGNGGIGQLKFQFFQFIFFF